MLGLATAASGAVGWLLGPFVGNAVFGVMWRRSRLQIAAVSDPPSPIFFVLLVGRKSTVCFFAMNSQSSDP